MTQEQAMAKLLEQSQFTREEVIAARDLLIRILRALDVAELVADKLREQALANAPAATETRQ